MMIMTLVLGRLKKLAKVEIGKEGQSEVKRRWIRGYGWILKIPKE